MDEVIPYCLLDPESGLEWRIPLTKADAVVYDLDHMRRFRKIKELKASKAPPFARWGDANSSRIIGASTASVSGSNVGDVAPTRAKGPKGATWKGNTPTILLNNSLPYRKWLRLNPVPECVYQKISDTMYKDGVDRSWEQIRAKVKTLKRAFNEAKQGKHGGQNWPHFWLMTYIFDEAIVDGEATLAPSGFDIDHIGLLNTTNVGTPMLSSTVVSFSDAAAGGEDQLVENPHHSILQSAADGEDQMVENPHHSILQSAADGEDQMVEPHHSIPEGENKCRDIEPDDHEWEDLEPGDNQWEDLENEWGGGIETTMKFVVIEDTNNNITAETAGRKSPPMTPRKQKLPTNKTSLRKESDTNSGARADSSSIDINVVAPERDFEIIKSPSKKKHKCVTGSLSVLNSPRKTPTKRKLPKHLLQLKESDTQRLVEQFVIKKDSLQQKTIPVNIWKEMSNALGGDFTWQLCREKFIQMDNSFKKTFLPLQGVMGGVKWPYYEAFCKLYGVPENYIEVMNASIDEDDDSEQQDEDGNDPLTEDHSKLWPKKALLLLLSLYKTKKAQFDGSSSLRHNFLYAQISADIKMKGYKKCSWEKCKRKMAAMKDKFRVEFDLCQKTGASPSTWEYYEKMMEIFDGASWLNAPLAISVGRGLIFTEEGETKENNRSGTRTRPSLKTKKKAEPKQSFKTWAQEQNILHKAELVQQMERMNSQFEENAKQRNAFYIAFANKYLKPNNEEED